MAGLITFYFFSPHREKDHSSCDRYSKADVHINTKRKKLKQNGAVSVLNFSELSEVIMLSTTNAVADVRQQNYGVF